MITTKVIDKQAEEARNKRRKADALLFLCVLGLAILLLIAIRTILWFIFEKTSSGSDAFGKFCTEIANGLLAGAIGSLSATLYYKILRRTEKEDESEELSDRVASRLQENLTSGVRNVKTKLKYEELCDLFSTSPRVVVIDTWIAADRLTSLESILLDALAKEDTKFTFILLHPNSPSASRRRRDMGGTNHSSVRKEILSSLEKLRELKKKSTKRSSGKSFDNLHVYCHDCVPTIQLYKAVDKAFLGFYFQKSASTQGPQLEVGTSGPLWEKIELHVNELLDESNDHKMKVELYPDDTSSERFLQQFDGNHLPCQLHDIADHMVNIGEHKIDRLVEEIARLSSDTRKNVGLRQATIKSLLVKLAASLGCQLSPQGQQKPLKGSRRR